MLNIIEFKNLDLFCIGDLHGSFNSIGNNIKRLDLNNAVIVVCGDIGFGFEKEEYYNQLFNKMTRVLKERNIHVVMVRGNHDDPAYFDGKHFSKRKFIHVVPDYTILKFVDDNDVVNHTVLCVGGGVSIDRTNRIGKMEQMAGLYKRYHSISLEEARKCVKKLYWSDELPHVDDAALQEITDSGLSIDVICTHTCPSFCRPTTKDGVGYWMELDPTLESDMDKERGVMNTIYDTLHSNGHPLKYWIYGHFHFHNTEYINDTKFVMLDMERSGICDVLDVR